MAKQLHRMKKRKERERKKKKKNGFASVASCSRFAIFTSTLEVFVVAQTNFVVDFKMKLRSIEQIVVNGHEIECIVYCTNICVYD